MKTFTLMFLVLWSTASQATCVRDEALKLRQEIELKGSFGWDYFLPSLFRPESYEMKISPVYHQGGTMFCWAYAALHTLRSFYYHVSEGDSVWRDFIRSVDTNPKYFQYVMSQVHNSQEAGWPIEAVYFYGKTIGQEAKENWVSYVPSDEKEGWQPHPPPDLHSYTPASYYLPMDQLVQKIREGFQTGTPTAYCTKLHCVSIYGATYNEGFPTRYLIADSGSGSTYIADPKKVHATIADIMTIGTEQRPQ